MEWLIDTMLGHLGNHSLVLFACCPRTVSHQKVSIRLFAVVNYQKARTLAHSAPIKFVFEFPIGVNLATCMKNVYRIPCITLWYFIFAGYMHMSPLAADLCVGACDNIST